MTGTTLQQVAMNETPFQHAWARHKALLAMLLPERESFPWTPKGDKRLMHASMMEVEMDQGAFQKTGEGGIFCKQSIKYKICLKKSLTMMINCLKHNVWPPPRLLSRPAPDKKYNILSADIGENCSPTPWDRPVGLWKDPKNKGIWLKPARDSSSPRQLECNGCPWYHPPRANGGQPSMRGKIFCQPTSLHPGPGIPLGDVLSSYPLR